MKNINLNQKLNPKCGGKLCSLSEFSSHGKKL